VLDRGKNAAAFLDGKKSPSSPGSLLVPKKIAKAQKNKNTQHSTPIGTSFNIEQVVQHSTTS
jgi:hypothetical protein